MKRAVFAAAFGTVLATLAVPSVWAQLVPPPPQAINPQTTQANLQATRQYYIAAIAGPSPNLAALTLMMTMMPKGGDLHHHYSGSVYAETYLDWVKQKNLCVWTIDNAERKAAKFGVEFEPSQVPADAKARCLDADAIRGPAHNAFYRELLSTWSDKDFHNHSQIQSAPDQHFFDTFFYVGGISKEDYRQGLQILKARAIAENVQYIETMFRSTPAIHNEALGQTVNDLPSQADESQVVTALAPFYDFLAADEAAGRAVKDYLAIIDAASADIDDAEFRMRFQSYVSRNDPPAEVFAGLYSAFAAANAGGKVVAVNFVGPENGPVSMRDYSLHMRMFAFLRQKFPGVKVALHAGELALGMVPPEGLQSHVREAIEIGGASRIGHGVDLPHERDATGLLRLMRERKVVVEINLTSNEFILGIKNEAHPLVLYRQIGVPYVISTDDSGVSRNNLSAEYVLYASRYKPSYDTIKETVLNSIRYSFLPEPEKAAELRGLQQRFLAFEARVRDLANGLPGAQPAR